MIGTVRTLSANLAFFKPQREEEKRRRKKRDYYSTREEEIKKSEMACPGALVKVLAFCTERGPPVKKHRLPYR